MSHHVQNHPAFAGALQIIDSQSVLVRMPSNIALIKYMGKRAGEREKTQPTNRSFSMSIPYLWTSVVVKPNDREMWSPLDPQSDFLTGPSLSRSKLVAEKGQQAVARFNDSLPTQASSLRLSLAGQQRFLNWWRQLKHRFGIRGTYHIASGNNFPSDCGIASSSSSFAALTVAAYWVATQREGRDLSEWSLEQLALLSAQGSGASGRSFFRPGALWGAEHIEPISLPLLTEAWHQVFIVSGEKKSVSSSEAHQRVFSSLLFHERPQRAEQRLRQMLDPALTWSELYQLAWEEFWDMHSLFETSRPAFGYMLPKTLSVLSACRQLWETENDGPVVTMDAGANVHLLWRKEQGAFAATWAKQVASHESLQFLQGDLF